MPVPRAAAIRLLKDIFSGAGEAKNFYRVLSKVKAVDGDDGKCVCEMTVEEEHTNPGGSLHGGLTATLVDNISTAALVVTDRAHPGVSVDMNITYLRPAMLGETIVISADVLKAGRTLAFTTVDIRRKSDNALIAQGRHTKAFPPDSR